MWAGGGLWTLLSLCVLFEAVDLLLVVVVRGDLQQGAACTVWRSFRSDVMMLGRNKLGSSKQRGRLILTCYHI